MRRLSTAWRWLAAHEQTVLTVLWVVLVILMLGLGVGLAWWTQHAPVEPLPFFK